MSITIYTAPCSKELQHNILITNETPARACLADFGLSTLTPSAPGEMSTTTAGGTPPYMAPELLDPDKFKKTNSRPTKPADMYAFGMVIYEVLTGFDPFYDQNLGTFQLARRVSGGLRPTKPSNAKDIGFGNGTWELVKECWKEKSERRPTIDRALLHLARVTMPLAVAGSTSRTHDSQGLGTSGMVFLKLHGLQQIMPHTLRMFLPVMPILRIPACLIRIQHPSNLQHLSSTNQPVLEDPQITLWLWQDLASADPVSVDHRLITALVVREGNRDIASKFTRKDKAIVINTLDKVSQSRPFVSAAVTHGIHPSTFKVLEGNQVPYTTRLHAITLMRTLRCVNEIPIIRKTFRILGYLPKRGTNEVEPTVGWIITRVILE